MVREPTQGRVLLPTRYDKAGASLYHNKAQWAQLDTARTSSHQLVQISYWESIIHRHLNRYSHSPSPPHLPPESL